MKAADLARTLNDRSIPGVRFVPIRFRPASSEYAGEECNGVNIVVTDRNVLDSPELGLEIAAVLRKLYPHDYRMDNMDTLMVNKVSMEAMEAGEDPRRIAEDWRDGIEKFEEMRKQYLLY